MLMMDRVPLIEGDEGGRQALLLPSGISALIRAADA